MYVKSLKISNLRNISDVGIDPDKQLNLFIGANGAGKTSVLESLVFLSKGRTFRTASASPLTGPDSKTVRVMADVEDADKSHRVGLERNPGGWRARLDGQDVAQLSDLAAVIPFVLLEPNSHNLVSGAPDNRRRYLDWGVFHVKHEFLVSWRQYSRALKQRNAALRTKQVPMLDPLDHQLNQYGQQLDLARKEWTDELQPLFKQLMTQMSPGLADLEFEYQPGWTGPGLEESLGAARNRDLERGSTTVGPHRCDLVFRQQGRPVRDRLSRGEQKIASTALLLAQAVLLSNSNRKPLLLLDDLASEFDAGHVHNVLGFGLELGLQMWVTGTDLQAYDREATVSGTVFHVKHGEIAREPGQHQAG